MTQTPLPARPTQSQIVQWVSSFSPETELADKFEVAANLFVEQALYAMSNMTAKDAMIAAGISVEKMQLLRGLPAEVAAALPLLMRIGEKAAPYGMTIKDVLQAVLDQMK